MSIQGLKDSRNFQIFSKRYFNNHLESNNIYKRVNDAKADNEENISDDLYKRFINNLKENLKKIKFEIINMNGNVKKSELITLIKDYMNKKVNFVYKEEDRQIDKDIKYNTYKYCVRILNEERNKLIKKVNNLFAYVTDIKTQWSQIKIRLENYYLFANFDEFFKFEKCKLLQNKVQYSNLYHNKKTNSKELEFYHAHKDISQAIFGLININSQEENMYIEDNTMYKEFFSLCIDIINNINNCYKSKFENEKREVQELIKTVMFKSGSTNSNNWMIFYDFISNVDIYTNIREQLCNLHKEIQKNNLNFMNSSKDNERKNTQFYNTKRSVFKSIVFNIKNSDVLKQEFCNENDEFKVIKSMLNRLKNFNNKNALLFYLLSPNSDVLDSVDFNNLKSKYQNIIKSLQKKDISKLFKNFVYYTCEKSWTQNKDNTVAYITNWNELKDELFSTSYLTNKTIHKLEESSKGTSKFKAEEYEKYYIEKTKKLNIEEDIKNLEKNYISKLKDTLKILLAECGICMEFDFSNFKIPNLNHKPSFKKMFTFDNIDINKDLNFLQKQKLFSLKSFVYKNIFNTQMEQEEIHKENFDNLYEKHKKYLKNEKNNSYYIFESFYKKYNTIEKLNLAQKNTMYQRLSECIFRLKVSQEFSKWFNECIAKKTLLINKLNYEEFSFNIDSMELVCMFKMLKNMSNYFISNVIQRLDNKSLNYDFSEIDPDEFKKHQILDLNYEQIQQLKTALTLKMFLNKDVNNEQEIAVEIQNKLLKVNLIQKNETPQNLDVSKLNNLWSSRYFLLGNDINAPYFKKYFKHVERIVENYKHLDSEDNIFTAINKNLDKTIHINDEDQKYAKCSSAYKKLVDEKNNRNEKKLDDLKRFILEHRNFQCQKNIVHFDVMQKHLNILKDLDRDIFKLIAKWDQLTDKDEKNKIIRNKLRHVEKRTLIETWVDKINLLRILYSEPGMRHIKNSIMKIVSATFNRHGYEIEFDIKSKDIVCDEQSIKCNHYFSLNDIKSTKDYNNLNVLSDVEIILTKDVFIVSN